MSGMVTAKALREKRFALHTANSALLERPAAEKRDALSAEETKEFEARDAEIVALSKQIEQVEAHEARTAELAASRGVIAGKNDVREVSGDEARAIEEKENRAFANYLRSGFADLSAEDKQIMVEKRAQSVGTNSAGGYTVAPEFYAVLTEAQKAWGGMRSVSTVIRTASGATLPMPTVNSTTIKGAILAENTQDSTQDETFSVVNISAYKYTSKIVLISLELLQDSAFDIQSYIAKALGVRLGRIQNDHFTTGTGSSQPNGIVTAASTGKTGATGQTLTVIYDDLVDLQHSVDPAYRQGAKWMMADSSLQVIKKLKDSQNRPLWLPGLAVKEPDTILGQPYVINQSMASMAANAKSIAYGALDSYFIRDVMDVSVQRLVERYADFGQVGFLAFARADGNLLNAGTNPVKLYVNSAT